MLKKMFSIISIQAFIFLIFAQTPEEIMKKVWELDRGTGAVAQMTMKLISESGQERIRSIKSYWNDYNDHLKTIRIFTAPADVKGTALLIYDFDSPSMDDDQWLYLPSLKKVKRIPSANKKESFMGSDFNYSDMTLFNLEDYTFELTGEADVEGNKTWVIRSIPKNEKVAEETGYSKAVRFIRKDNFVPVRAVLWVNNQKVVKYLEVTKLELIGTVWVRREMIMTSKLDKRILHQTKLIYDSIEFNQKLDENIFNKSSLESDLQ